MTTIDRWSGEFGNEYHQRNISALASPRRGDFWASLLAKFPVESVLEVGCGSGANLRHISVPRVVGVDVNAKAVAIARLIPGVLALRASANRIPLPDQAFELVFTVGCLIHIPENELTSVLDEMYRLSSKYIFCAEYFSEKTEEIEYRGERGLLWKRDYEYEFISRYQLRLLDDGFLSRDDGFDNVTFWLWERK